MHPQPRPYTITMTSRSTVALKTKSAHPKAPAHLIRRDSRCDSRDWYAFMFTERSLLIGAAHETLHKKYLADGRWVLKGLKEYEGSTRDHGWPVRVTGRWKKVVEW